MTALAPDPAASEVGFEVTLPRVEVAFRGRCLPTAGEVRPVGRDVVRHGGSLLDHRTLRQSVERDLCQQAARLRPSERRIDIIGTPQRYKPLFAAVAQAHCPVVLACRADPQAEARQLGIPNAVFIGLEWGLPADEIAVQKGVMPASAVAWAQIAARVA